MAEKGDDRRAQLQRLLIDFIVGKVGQHLFLERNRLLEFDLKGQLSSQKLGRLIIQHPIDVGHRSHFHERPKYLASSDTCRLGKLSNRAGHFQNDRLFPWSSRVRCFASPLPPV